MESYEEFLSKSLPRPPEGETLRKLEELRDLIRSAGEEEPAAFRAVEALAAALDQKEREPAD